MLGFAVAVLFTIAGIVVLLALVDSAIRARHTFAQLREEAALLKAGYLPEIEPTEVRLRPARRAMPDRRVLSGRLPRPSSAAA